MTIMWNEILEQPRVLETCLEKNLQVIRDIVEMIKTQGVHSVIIAARGTSDHAAVYGKYLIELTLGIPVSLAAPSVFTMYGKNIKMNGNLVIGISQSGKAADVLEVIRAANRQGAVTVSITNDPASPLAVESRYHLYCNSGLEKSVAATKTFTAQLYLLAQLTSEWADDSNMKHELATIPDIMRNVLETSDIIQEKAQRYRFMNECFVLARGVNYAIALESALKIQETTYVRAKAFATSDFHHGPFAMIEKDMPVIVYAPQGPSLPDVTEMIHKIRQTQAELIIISNQKELLELGTTAFAIPETKNDILSPFFNIVVGQMFACQLALAKGLNPDSPRGLNKVTITR